MENPNTSSPMPTIKRDSIAIPIAIVIAAALIAGAIYMSGSKTEPKPVGVEGAIPSETEPKIRQVDSTDHIRGNPNAQIMLVEYSDFDCPFCKNFHETMQRIIDEYGATGKVAWVYRHFPLEQLHPNAPMLAESAECVAELGGDPAFWKYTDLIFGEKPINDATDITRLPEFAEKAGVSRTEFESCLSSGRMKDKITASIAEAMAAGGRGTPHTLVLVGNQSGVVNGAQPYEVVKQIVDNLIAQMDGGGIVQ